MDGIHFGDLSQHYDQPRGGLRTPSVSDWREFTFAPVPLNCQISRNGEFSSNSPFFAAFVQLVSLFLAKFPMFGRVPTVSYDDTRQIYGNLRLVAGVFPIGAICHIDFVNHTRGTFFVFVMRQPIYSISDRFRERDFTGPYPENWRLELPPTRHPGYLVGGL